MATRINVPAGFKADFDYVLKACGLTAAEGFALRDRVRTDFAEHGSWVQQTAASYRFADTVWGRLPTLLEAMAYLKDWGVDVNLGALSRCGDILLARICAEAAGVIPAAVTAR